MTVLESSYTPSDVITWRDLEARPVADLHASLFQRGPLPPADPDFGIGP